MSATSIKDFPFLLSKQVLSSKDDLAHYGRDWLKDWQPCPSLVLLPESYEQVVQIVQTAIHKKLALIPSGGRTGLSGGATALNGEIIVSLEKLNKIIEVDRVGRTMTVQAGTSTQTIKEAAEKDNLYFPLDVPSKGSCQIGGNVATNAGGIHVSRYGNTRDLVLGMKVVTGKGELINFNGTLIKNNTGYDLKSLFIGSEGTLGIIVEVSLKLTSPPGELRRLLLAHDSLDKLTKFLEFSRDSLPTLSAFEYFTREALDKVLKFRQLRDPFQKKYPHYTLIEAESGTNPDATERTLESFTEAAIDQGLLVDAVLSQNSTQAQELMQLRELISDTLSSNYTIHKNDISVPVAEVVSFMKELNGLMSKTFPSVELVVFGHLGDGNLHLNWLKPDNHSVDEFKKICKQGDDSIFSLVRKFNGSISAEHGVGLLKKDYLQYSRTSTELSLMRQIKATFDPIGIFNPGKIFD